LEEKEEKKLASGSLGRKKGGRPAFPLPAHSSLLADSIAGSPHCGTWYQARQNLFL